jgi:hypothetical protein
MAIPEYSGIVYPGIVYPGIVYPGIAILQHECIDERP